MLRIFIEKARNIMASTFSGHHMTQKEEHVFREFFGCGLLTVSKLWMLLLSFGFLNENEDPAYLLWALMFMKMYGTESDTSTRAGVNPNKFHDWSWSLINSISDLEAEVVRQFFG
jgi:hypothetical protein